MALDMLQKLFLLKNVESVFIAFAFFVLSIFLAMQTQIRSWRFKSIIFLALQTPFRSWGFKSVMINEFVDSQIKFRGHLFKSTFFKRG